MTLSFGKYRGCPLAAVPGGYLRWLQTVARTDGLRDAIAEELSRRGGAGPSIRPLLRDLSPEGRALAGRIVTRGFRAVAVEIHPDHGGDPARMRDLNLAHEALRRLLAEAGA